jgi:hypothetical protein
MLVLSKLGFILNLGYYLGGLEKAMARFMKRSLFSINLQKISLPM